MGCRLLPTRQYCSCKKFEALTAEQQEKEVRDIYKDLVPEPASIPKPEPKITLTAFNTEFLSEREKVEAVRIAKSYEDRANIQLAKILKSLEAKS